MRKAGILTILVCLFCTVNTVLADNIRGINIYFMPIGHANNPDDTNGTPNCGAVNYNYRIGMYEVTNAQWNYFTAAAGAPTGNDGGYNKSAANYTLSQQPANCISWFEAAQFCNYLTSGDKSKGAYLFSGNNTNPGSFLGINRTSAQATYGTIYVLPTEDEWYKAAYYKPDGSGYSLYANGLNTIPSADNGWNSYGGLYHYPWVVGAGTQEQNSTYDMMGNVWEWNEKLSYRSFRGARGGSFAFYRDPLASSAQFSFAQGNEGDDMGFRVVSIIPEPATLLLTLGGLLFRKRNLI